MNRPPPRSTLFPYTPLSRSELLEPVIGRIEVQRAQLGVHDVGARRPGGDEPRGDPHRRQDRKSTRLNSSHLVISYAVFCLKKKNTISARRTLHNRSDVNILT